MAGDSYEDRIKGVAEAHAVVEAFPLALATCEGTQEDIAAIEAWVQIFTDPAELALTVGENYVLHHDDVLAGIAQEQADWAAGLDFNAGADAAALVTLLVGPIGEQSAYEDYGAFTAMAIPDYLAGFVWGLTGDNQLDEFEKCFQDSDAVWEMGWQVVGDFAGGEVLVAFEDLGTLAGMIPPLMTTCSTDLQDDIQEIASWALIFTQPAKLLERVGKNWLLYYIPIQHDFAVIQSDWLKEDFWGAGVASADVATKLLTPGIPAAGVAQVVEGFLYGFVQDENLIGIEGCMTGAEELGTLIQSAVADFEMGGAVNITRGVATLVYVIEKIPAEVSACEEISGDVAALQEWS